MGQQLKTKWLKSVALASGLALLTAGCSDAIQRNDRTDIPPATVDVVSPGAPPSVSEPSHDTRAYVRVLHLVPEAGPVSLMLNGKSIIDSVAYETASDYVGLGDDKTDINTTGKHEFTLAGADGKPLGDPVAVDLAKGEDVTLMVSGMPGKLTVTPYHHTAKPTARTARLALLYTPHLGPDDKLGPNLDVMLDDKVMQNAVKAGEGIAYQDVEPGIHKLKVMSGQDVALTQPLDLQAGNSYSVIVYKDKAGKAAIKMLPDKFLPDLINAPTVTTEKSIP